MIELMQDDLNGVAGTDWATVGAGALTVVAVIALAPVELTVGAVVGVVAGLGAAYLAIEDGFSH